MDQRVSKSFDFTIFFAEEKKSCFQLYLYKIKIWQSIKNEKFQLFLF